MSLRRRPSMRGNARKSRACRCGRLRTLAEDGAHRRHYAVGDGAGFEPHPLTGPQVAALAAAVGERWPVYGLLVLFMAYTGLRAAEVQGLEVRDLTLTTGPDGTMRSSVRLQRTKTRRKAEWVTGTPKSKTSRRTVSLPPWLAARMADYLGEAPACQRADSAAMAATATREPETASRSSTGRHR